MTVVRVLADLIDAADTVDSAHNVDRDRPSASMVRFDQLLDHLSNTDVLAANEVNVERGGPGSATDVAELVAVLWAMCGEGLLIGLGDRRNGGNTTLTWVGLTTKGRAALDGSDRSAPASRPRARPAASTDSDPVPRPSRGAGGQGWDLDL